MGQTSGHLEIDLTRQGKGVLLDWVVGSAVRQSLPAKIRRS